MFYYKPQPQDHRKPENADLMLFERIKATIDALIAMGKNPAKIHFGFADEVAGQLHSNNARFWAFEHLPRKVNTSRATESFFGFYSFQGNSLLVDLEGGKEADIKEALLAVKEANKEASAIVIIWDNAQTHKSLDTWGWENQIYFIPLPTYSPDLNPIERLWKSLKKWVNETTFIKQLDDLKKLFHKGFEMFESNLNFMESWWAKYQSILSCFCPIFDSNTL